MSAPEPMLPTGFDAAQTLNRDCYCRTLDLDRLRDALAARGQGAELADILHARPHLFAGTVVFVSQTIADRIAEVIAAIERLTSLPGFREAALGRAPAIARCSFGPAGVFMGYDFHISPAAAAEGAMTAQLIEINTNAGGAALNALLARAQRACCRELDRLTLPDPGARDFEADFVASFCSEWRSQRGGAELGLLLIVDDAPGQQYLAPEFQLFQDILVRHGIRAAIADPRDLRWEDGRLWRGAEVVDMVYNRLTDFYLEAQEHAALRAAYEAGAVVLTPHPHAHALFADKRNLVLMGEQERLAGWGLDAADCALLAAHVPETRLVSAADAARLWSARRTLFFKPVAGFGGRATYRGDKLTRRVWDEILSSDYVAQRTVPPGERPIELDGERVDLKFDVRAYTYQGRVQLLAARMYAGQTTNFRTPGGGFAPVVVVPVQS